MPHLWTNLSVHFRKRYYLSKSSLHTGKWTVLTLTPTGVNTSSMELLQRLNLCLTSQKTIDYAQFGIEIGSTDGKFHIHGLVHSPRPLKFNKFKGHFTHPLLGHGITEAWLKYCTKDNNPYTLVYTNRQLYIERKVNWGSLGEKIQTVPYGEVEIEHYENKFRNYSVYKNKILSSSITNNN